MHTTIEDIYGCYMCFLGSCNFRMLAQNKKIDAWSLPTSCIFFNAIWLKSLLSLLHLDIAFVQGKVDRNFTSTGGTIGTSLAG